MRRTGIVLFLFAAVLTLASCRHETRKPEGKMRHILEGRTTIYQGEESLDFKIVPIAGITSWDFHTHKGGSTNKRQLNAYSYLIRHPVHGNILIDLGYPAVTAEDPGEYPGFPASALMKIRMEKGGQISEKIKRHGLQPEEIDLILFTHLHIDHMGDIRSFPSSRILVHKTEWAAAMEKGRSHGYRPDYLQGLSPETFVFPEGSPCGPFERSLDLLGDGSIIAVPTPGHTLGHVSYFIHTGGQSFFLTGDTAWVEENFQVPVRKGWLPHRLVEADREAQQDSLDRIHRLYRNRADLLIVPCHDGKVLTDDRLKPYILQ
jgi:glyoxylase-like metal-dependent hydrolase (beta-lactamase superfamily II)